MTFLLASSSLLKLPKMQATSQQSCIYTPWNLPKKTCSKPLCGFADPFFVYVLNQACCNVPLKSSNFFWQYQKKVTMISFHSHPNLEDLVNMLSYLRTFESWLIVTALGKSSTSVIKLLLFWCQWKWWTSQNLVNLSTQSVINKWEGLRRLKGKKKWFAYIIGLLILHQFCYSLLYDKVDVRPR